MEKEPEKAEPQTSAATPDDEQTTTGRPRRSCTLQNIDRFTPCGLWQEKEPKRAASRPATKEPKRAASRASTKIAQEKEPKKAVPRRTTIAKAKTVEAAATLDVQKRKRGRTPRPPLIIKKEPIVTLVPDGLRRRGRPRKGWPAVPKLAKIMPGRKRGRRRTRPTINDNDPIQDLLDLDDDDDHTQFLKKTRIEVGQMFMDKWAVIDVLDPYQGDTCCRRYLVSDKETGYTTDATLRIYPARAIDTLFQEFSFLDKMEKYKRAHLALLALDMKLVEGPDFTFAYIITAARPGPTLQEIMGRHKTLSVRDATRFTYRILEIVHHVSAIGYVLLDVDLSHFALDVESGRVYLWNCTNLAISFEKHGMSEHMEGMKALKWRGGNKYAPLAYHNDSTTPMTDCDSIEAVFYMFLDLCGRLPWGDKMSLKNIVAKKQRWAELEEGALTSDLTPPGAMFWLNLRRGRRFVLKRTNNLANGNIIMREWRQRPSGKSLPTASMLEYPLFFDALRIFGNWDDGIPFSNVPWDFCEPETTVEMALVGEMNKMRVDVRELEADIGMLQRRKTEDEKHKQQMNTEVRFNEQFLRNYLGEDAFVRRLTTADLFGK